MDQPGKRRALGKQVGLMQGIARIAPTAFGRKALVFLVGFLLSSPAKLCAQQDQSASKELFAWSRLPELPEPIGVGGACAGISGDALIVAGGAHFREPFLDGGKKSGPTAYTC